MSASVYDDPAPPDLSSTFIATGAPFQNDGLAVRIESPKRCTSGLSMRTHHSTRRPREFGIMNGRPGVLAARRRQGRSTTTSKPLERRPSDGPDTLEDRPRFHAGPGSPGRVVHRNHECVPVDSQRPQMLGELGADQLGPAGENHLHRHRRNGCTEPGEQLRHRFARRGADPWATGRSRNRDRLSIGRIRVTAIPSGRGAAVVRMDCPAGNSATRARLACRVELGEDVVQEQDRIERRSGPNQLVHRQAEGECQAALFALGRVRSGLPPVDRQNEVVAVGTHGVDAPAQVVSPGWRPGRRGGRRPSCVRSAAPPGLGPRHPARRA